MGLGAGVWPQASSCCNLSQCFLAPDPGEYLWKHGGSFSPVNREGKVITTTQKYTNICSITKRYKTLQLLRNVSQFVRVCVKSFVCVEKARQSNVNVKIGFRHQSVVLWQWVQPLWTKARYTPVGESICQHLSQYAGWTPKSRLPTNLTDKKCHPPVSNILG